MKLDIEILLKELNEVKTPINIMEVCGTHTMAICRNGIKDIISKNINLISGPGCPVCVTSDIDIDRIYEVALVEGTITATYGDMLRVPGSKPEISLIKAKSKGADVRVVYSAMDALSLAEDNPQKCIVFLGIGFETTAPATATLIKEAKENGIENLRVLSLHKKVEPIMKSILNNEDLNIDGFLIPGHVASIIGRVGFDFMKDYGCIGAVAGFDGEEILYALHRIVQARDENVFDVFNCYKRAVRDLGNPLAMDVIREVYHETDVNWRGLGVIENSGLGINDKYTQFDIEKDPNYRSIMMQTEPSEKNKACVCGEILMGKKMPFECPAFAETCTPLSPLGPCMVSSEGSCAAFYKYERREGLK